MTREEAIDIIRKNIPHLGIGATEMTDALNELVPELRESEDERTRKELLYHIQSEIDTYDNMISGDYDSRDKEDKKVHSMLKRAKAYLEKQKEQKPAEWSEDDEAHRKSIISTIEMCMKDCERANVVLDCYENDIAWLKSLRPSWKPSEEDKKILHAIEFTCWPTL